MTKYLNAEDMLNNYEADCEAYENNGDSLDTESWMMDYLKNHPSADVQPVIHCKGCIHWHNKDKKYLCPLYREELKAGNSPDILWNFIVYDGATDDDFFCKRGETGGDKHE